MLNLKESMTKCLLEQKEKEEAIIRIYKKYPLNSSLLPHQLKIGNIEEELEEYYRLCRELEELFTFGFAFFNTSDYNIEIATTTKNFYVITIISNYDDSIIEGHIDKDKLELMSIFDLQRYLNELYYYYSM